MKHRYKKGEHTDEKFNVFLDNLLDNLHNLTDEIFYHDDISKMEYEDYTCISYKEGNDIVFAPDYINGVLILYVPQNILNTKIRIDKLKELYVQTT